MYTKRPRGTSGSRETRWNSELARWNSEVMLADDGKIDGRNVARIRTNDCNPYCEVCRIYRSKLVKHDDNKFGQMNGETVSQPKISSPPPRQRSEQIDVETRRSQLSSKDNENVTTLRELSKQVRELENDLYKLKEERHRLLAECDQLRNDVSSKETNLLRCESQLTKSEREKRELLEQTRWLEEKERKLTAELAAYTKRQRGTYRSTERRGSPEFVRWTKDTAPADSGRNLGGTATVSIHTKDCNPYCEVCRIYRSKLVKHADNKFGQMNGETRSQPQISSPLPRAQSEHINIGRFSLEEHFQRLEEQYQRSIREHKSKMNEQLQRLEQLYQKTLKEKMAIQKELTLCLDEQERQKRLVQRYMSENQSYESLLTDKDREISNLKATIRDLEQEYEGFRKNLSEQEANLLRLHRDLSTANAVKEKIERGRLVLADDYKRLQQQYQKLYQDKAAMQRELELCMDEQDKQKRLLQRYLDEIQSYERLLAEKEKERLDMLLQFQASAERLCKCGQSAPGSLPPGT